MTITIPQPVEGDGSFRRHVRMNACCTRPLPFCEFMCARRSIWTRPELSMNYHTRLPLLGTTSRSRDSRRRSRVHSPGDASEESTEDGQQRRGQGGHCDIGIEGRREARWNGRAKTRCSGVDHWRSVLRAGDRLNRPINMVLDEAAETRV